MSEQRDGIGTGSGRPVAAAARRQGRAVATVPEVEVGKGRPTPARDVRASRGSPVARAVRFLREVVAELRKVIWPSRKELVTYTIVVLVFVSFVVAFVAALDIAFGKGVFYLFG